MGLLQKLVLSTDRLTAMYMYFHGVGVQEMCHSFLTLLQSLLSRVLGKCNKPYKGVSGIGACSHVVQSVH